MTIEIKVPAMGESVTEATVARWFKKEGDAVKRDEPLLELETDKVTVEVPAPADGAIESISVKAGRQNRSPLISCKGGRSPQTGGPCAFSGCSQV
jgi:pyruvate/2-oxoglutarate dehydrogenase complex dihydrolipoamide acyltransferase (E2) component